MNRTVSKRLSANKKKELNEKLKANNLSLPVDKYNLYLLPDSKVCFDGVVSDLFVLKAKTIDLIQAKFNITHDIDVYFNTDSVEFYPLNQGSFFYNDTVGYNELVRLL